MPASSGGSEGELMSASSQLHGIGASLALHGGSIMPFRRDICNSGQLLARTRRLMAVSVSLREGLVSSNFVDVCPLELVTLPMAQLAWNLDFDPRLSAPS